MIFAIYDLEVLKAIPPKDEADRLSGIQYCEGWGDFAGMGVSCWALCFFDSASEAIFGDQCGTDPKALIAELDKADIEMGGGLCLGGFNSKKFDDRLMAAQGLECRSDFDILDLVLASAGMEDVAYWEMQPKRSYALGKIAEANGYQKTLSGELAPIEWQKGRNDKVLAYCRNDVLIEAETLKRLMQGTLIDPNTGQILPPPMLIC
jgi:hypothetical protein